MSLQLQGKLCTLLDSKCVLKVFTEKLHWFRINIQKKNFEDMPELTEVSEQLSEQTRKKCIVCIVLFYLPYLSSIHEKANCIAILWTVSPHSLGSCLFRGLWVTCLPHKGGGVPLSALPKDTTSELAGLFSTTFPKCRAPSREAVNTTF